MAGKSKIVRGALEALTDIGSDLSRRAFMKGAGATAATGALVGLKGAPKLFDDLTPAAKKAVKGGQKINLTDLISFKKSDEDVHEAFRKSTEELKKMYESSSYSRKKNLIKKELIKRNEII